MNNANAANSNTNDRNQTARPVKFARRALTVASMWMACALAGAADLAADLSGPSGPQGVAADASGNIYVADMKAHVIRKISVSGDEAILAGSPGAAGFKDGVGALARFNAPASLAVDLQGNIYIADADNHMIRRISPTGDVTTLAGQAAVPGKEDGPCSEAEFNSPHGVAVDQEGNVYVADMANSTIRKITSECQVSTLAGSAGVAGSEDGSGSAASFRFPQDLATDRAGNVYVSDINSHTIRKITPDGLVSTLAGRAGLSGNDDGAGREARFHYPKGIASDRANNVFVVDSNNYAIRRITPDGVVSTVMERSENAGMTLPSGLAVSGESLHVTLYSGVTVVQDLPQYVSIDRADSWLAAMGL